MRWADIFSGTIAKTKESEVTQNKILTDQDLRTILNFKSSSELTLSLDISGLTYPEGFEFIARKQAAGDILFIVPTSLTLNGSGTKLSQLYEAIYFRYSNNNWTAIGNLTS